MQEELNDSIRDLELPKDGAQLFTSFIEKKDYLAKDVKVDYFRNREEKFRTYFTKIDGPSMVYCHDEQGLMDELKSGVYKDEEWSLFIDSSKRSFKGVLLYNKNKFASIPIADSTVLKETHQNLGFVLKKIKYSELENKKIK